MQLKIVNIHDLYIPADRQRREFKAEEIVKLADSISQVGLIHPVVIHKDEEGRDVLVAGERRVKAMQYIWNFGESFRCGQDTLTEGNIPCLYQGQLDPLAAFEMELEENIRREDLTWQERSMATGQLYELRRLQAEKRGDAPPTVAELAAEIRPDFESPNTAYNTTREELIVSRHLDDPDVQKAKSTGEALRILKRKEDLRRSAELGETVGKTFTSAIHQLLRGDCLAVMGGLPDGTVDVILTDPPYGIDAHKFGDSGGRTPGAHFYDDSFETWSSLMKLFAVQTFRLTRPQAHAYVFCDIDNFVFLKSYMSAAGWKCFRTPIIWSNPTSMRTPWVDMGPQRKYQICLYANKGSKPVTRIYPDVVSYPSDENLNHPAQKPVALYEDLLKRSIKPGDTVLDPFCGSGTIFPACHNLKCRAIGIEVDDAACGIAIARLDALK